MDKRSYINIIDVNKNKINKEKFNKYLNFNGLLIIRNLFNEKEIKNELNKFRKKKIYLTKKSGRYFYKKKNFSRYDKELVYNKYIIHGRYQFLHTLFTWNKDNSFKKIFKKLIEFRNKMYGIKTKKEVFKYKNSKYINVPKILHYPNNGFLGKHIDNSPSQDRNFIIIASEKGRDYFRGGLSYKIDNKYKIIEKYLKIGDLVCNDYKIMHGVKKVLVNKQQSGRYSIVLSMHKV